MCGLLKSVFGFAGFRANQEEVCRAAIAGRDLLLVMPTGAGKSLCFQLPAIARGGTALVITTARAEEIPACITHLLRVDDCRVVAQGRYTAGADEVSPDRPQARPLARASAPGAGAIVELRSVTVRYGESTILDHVNLTVRKGERMVICGPSGSGKSTLLRVLAGFAIGLIGGLALGSWAFGHVAEQFSVRTGLLAAGATFSVCRKSTQIQGTSPASFWMRILEPTG